MLDYIVWDKAKLVLLLAVCGVAHIHCTGIAAVTSNR